MIGTMITYFSWIVVLMVFSARVFRSKSIDNRSKVLVRIRKDE
jgi:hypothetical protein